MLRTDGVTLPNFYFLLFYQNFISAEIQMMVYLIDLRKTLYTTLLTLYAKSLYTY